MGFTHNPPFEIELTAPLTVTSRLLLKQALQKAGLDLIYHHIPVLEKLSILNPCSPENEPLLPVSQTAYYEKAASSPKELFSACTGISIDSYRTIRQIEKAKEMLLYEDFDLDHIAQQLYFQSTAHLAQQCLEVTGLAPEFFLELKRRKQILIIEANN
jgi:AraC-like DNA-binding protein